MTTSGANPSDAMTSGTPAPPKAPVVRAARVEDIVAAVEAGLRDFRAAPLYGLFFGLVYALAGMAVVYAATHFGLIWLAFPLAAGFALIGPFAAVGLYEVSRRRQAGEPLSWGVVLGAAIQSGKRELGWMALVSLFAFIIWMYQVRLLYAFIFGLAPLDTSDPVGALFGTQEGLLFLGIGTLWGAVLAVAVFALTVISFPLLLDRDHDFVTAMITSVKAVVASPKVMVGWGIVTALVLLLSMLPYFIGLIVTLPVLGHATWHLYSRLVERGS